MEAEHQEGKSDSCGNSQESVGLLEVSAFKFSYESGLISEPLSFVFHGIKLLNEGSVKGVCEKI